ncbi:cell division protein ZapA [Gracilimonas sediminicola]|uniref:Cell division protein ZapA n=1 Tax=Gracilimonas sediminicola TaxID=2952158 RepID=A0A9X2RH92_9BACT|nr:cell division protein ZapA [Gracilimonas sediminicola]MCP9292962.1 cell division protein ZapA [Gracilimonas sediminicola]
MKSIKVTILGKQYPLKVEDHEEESMIRICKFVDERFKTYRQQLVKQPESTVMVLAALSIAEELFEARNATTELENNEEVLMERVNHSLERLLTEIRE